ncbi:uncharacterized protein PgNI_02176 [Pyricularia grisea]|uniref:Uncharacterized protein n=1 Tax=Pyricularia grisea TaxID=148305 RepID=A0A6P8BJ96_PYRGI|nr:uncharacterized protein PgNI_02176 [Pyricularia grisea]TLD16652.1 hypothetical protein PgNI_02176 [Pyricularia grisea]
MDVSVIEELEVEDELNFEVDVAISSEDELVSETVVEIDIVGAFRDNTEVEKPVFDADVEDELGLVARSQSPNSAWHPLPQYASVDPQYD